VEKLLRGVDVDPRALAEMERQVEQLDEADRAHFESLNRDTQLQIRMLDAVLQGPSDTYRNRKRVWEYWRHKARRTAEICGRCFRPLDPQETVYIDVLYGHNYDNGNYSREWGPVGECCVSEPMRRAAEYAQESGTVRGTKGFDFNYYACDTEYWTAERECHTCERRMFPQIKGFRSRGPFFCCKRCEERHYNKLRAKQPETKVCPMCDTEFTAKRKDAKYCSPACRQRHHRMWKSLG
jgi:hypothetical protein